MQERGGAPARKRVNCPQAAQCAWRRSPGRPISSTISFAKPQPAQKAEKIAATVGILPGRSVTPKPEHAAGPLELERRTEERRGARVETDVGRAADRRQRRLFEQARAALDGRLDEAIGARRAGR